MFLWLEMCSKWKINNNIREQYRTNLKKLQINIQNKRGVNKIKYSKSIVNKRF